MSTEAEAIAREMGWRPREEFRGDAEKWVDAETFVSRGENFIPILRKDRDTFKQRASDLEHQVGELKATLTAAQEAIEALKEHQSENTKRQVEVARRELMTQIRAAREEGNVEAEVELQERLAEVKAAQAAAPAPAPKPAAAPAPTPAAPDPDSAAWLAQNTWFTESSRKRGLALGIAEELRSSPETKHLVGKAFFDKLDQELAKEPAFGGERPTSKVDGGRPTGNAGGGGSAPKGRTYADLPPEAKAVCDKQASKLVGPGRAFKDEAGWRAHYVQQFFLQE